MSDLADKKCIPCEGGIPSFNLDEIHKYLKKVDGWDVICLLYTSPSPRDLSTARMPSSA